MTKNSKKNSVSIGNCGEYFVAAELERRGWTAAVPMSNTKDFDILAINRTSHRQVAIQVKSTQKGSKRKKWVLTKKCEDLSAPHIIYFFVALNDLGMPEYHIVPSEYIAHTIKQGHQKWLVSPGRKGAQHNDNNLREFNDKEGAFLDNWELLDAAATPSLENATSTPKDAPEATAPATHRPPTKRRRRRQISRANKNSHKLNA